MPPPLHVPGSPPAEHRRSRAAQRVAQRASKSSLFFANFEHRARLPSPPQWLPEGAEERESVFEGGVLAESKYQAFRHDLLIASFHPGHRAQWTAHELCHALVGFAYHPGSSTFFHALAAWLAELLPVTLWYFLDEADVRKCDRHATSGPLFQTFCGPCEQAALAGPRPSDARSERCLREGKRYLQRELLAIARSRKRGVIEGTRFATIDLAQDALSYAAGHAARLKAPEMERFVAQFFSRQQGHHASLDALEERVIALFDDLSGGARAKPWRATRWDYAAQDVGYRLLALRAVTDGDLARALDTLVDTLAQERTEAGMRRVIDAYGALAAQANKGRRKLALVAPEQLFAVGYELPLGHGSSLTQLAAGIASACPGAYESLGRAQRETVRLFSGTDQAMRVPIGRRFARFLGEHQPGPGAQLARVEAAISHVAPRDLQAASLDSFEARDDRLQLAPGVEIVVVEHDVLNVEPKQVRRAPRLPDARALLILRGTSGDVDVMELPLELATRAQQSGGKALLRAAFGMDDTTLDELLGAGVLVPAAYSE
jgi:hypothetical protein